ncbi:MAG: permease prefix domain 2-containing transporter [Spirosomataceae bacterium]
MQPPRWADRLLEWFCAPHLLEEVQGDLHEQFHRQAKLFGEKLARRQYVWSVLSFVRPFALKRKPSLYPSTSFFKEAMIKNYFKIAFRNLAKNLRFTTINIVGMTLGMACALVIFLIVRHETSFDVNQSKGDRIYRVETENIKEGHIYPGTYTGMDNALRNDMPEVEKVVPLIQIWGSTFATGNGQNRFKDKFVFADQNLLQVFDYQWIVGNANKALTESNSIVLTKKYATKYFGTTDVLGKTIRMGSKQDLMVTGVVEDYSSTSSFNFDMMVSFQTLKLTNPNFELDKWNGWDDSHQVFVLLKKGIQATQVNQRFVHIVEKYMGKEALEDKRFALSPLTNIHYSDNLSGHTANVKLLKTLSLIGFLVLLISCFNFINLSTAQIFKRAKEVGIRKVIGSSRGSLVHQFLIEAGLITGFAIVFAVLITKFSLPSIGALFSIPIQFADLFTFNNLLFVLALLGITTLLAGLYPALKLSGMMPIGALHKNKMTDKKQWFPLRQTLVVVQFTVSLVLISAAMLINDQLSFFQKADLGFNKDAIVIVGLPSNETSKLQAMRNQLMAASLVKNVSFSFNSASAESNWMQAIEFREGKEPVPVKTQMKMGDSHFMDTYGIKLLAGRALQDMDTTNQVIVNEIFLNKIGLQNPQDAVGQKVYYGNGNEFATIVGVAKNFNVNSLHQKIDPTFIQIVPRNFYQVGIKLNNNHLTTDNLHTTVATIEKIWTATFPGQLFEYNFLDEELTRAYKSEMRTARLIETATLIAVLIACLGLFGLATFIAEQRTKEIGVRKVMGASVANILMLLSKDFLKLVIIAIVIATPIAWWVMSQWLQNFEFKINISVWAFVLTGLIMMGIAMFTVSLQSLKAALMNPVKSLKSE